MNHCSSLLAYISVNDPLLMLVISVYEPLPSLLIVFCFVYGWINAHLCYFYLFYVNEPLLILLSLYNVSGWIIVCHFYLFCEQVNHCWHPGLICVLNGKNRWNSCCCTYIHTSFICVGTIDHPSKCKMNYCTPLLFVTFLCLCTDLLLPVYYVEDKPHLDVSGWILDHLAKAPSFHLAKWTMVRPSHCHRGMLPFLIFLSFLSKQQHALYCKLLQLPLLGFDGNLPIR